MTTLARKAHSLEARPRRWLYLMSVAGGQRRVFGRLLRRELAGLTDSLRFRASVLLILGLMIASAMINAVRYRNEVRSYQHTLAEYEAELAGATVAGLATIRHPAVKPPWKLAFLVDGGESSRPNVYRQPLSPWLSPELESRHGGNRRLNPSEPLDWLFLIRVVLSLAAFVLSYDAFCGQRQRAVLRMVLSYPVARWQVVASKAVAIWLSLAIPFVIGVPWCLLILRGYGGISFTLPESIKVIQVVILGLWASAVFGLIGLLVSALSREAARCLAGLALIWITAVVVIPAAGSLVVSSIRPLPAGFEAWEKMSEIRERVERDGPGTWRPKSIARTHGFDLEREAARTQNQRQALQEEFRRKLIEQRFQRQMVARRLSSLSPMSLIQDLAELGVGSGPYRDHAFNRQAWEFRSCLEEHVKTLDLADPDSPHLHFIQNFMSELPVDAERLPRFDFRELSVAEGMGEATGHVLALALATLLLAGAVLVAFGREDVG